MAVKKQLILISVVFDDYDTYGESAEAAISHRLFNEDGIKEWDSRVIKEESLFADITAEDLKLVTKDRETKWIKGSDSQGDGMHNNYVSFWKMLVYADNQEPVTGEKVAINYAEFNE